MAGDRAPVEKSGRIANLQDETALCHLIARFERNLTDDAIALGHQCVFHFHGFNDCHARSTRDALPSLHIDCNDFAVHGRFDSAIAIATLMACGTCFTRAKNCLPPLMQSIDLGAIANKRDIGGWIKAINKQTLAVPRDTDGLRFAVQRHRP